jgi:hypothetical protein
MDFEWSIFVAALPSLARGASGVLTIRNGGAFPPFEFM